MSHEHNSKSDHNYPYVFSFRIFVVVVDGRTLSQMRVIDSETERVRKRCEQRTKEERSVYNTDYHTYEI